MSGSSVGVGLMEDELGSKIGMQGSRLGSNIITYIGGGASTFLLEYTCSGLEEGCRFSLCIMFCESCEIETRGGKEQEGRSRRNKSLSLSSKKLVSL